MSLRAMKIAYIFQMRQASVKKKDNKYFVTDEEGSILPSNPVYKAGPKKGKPKGHDTMQEAQDQLAAIEYAKGIRD